nr:MAG TPA: hypothetical protein [Caudoviricetes sp.]
MLWQLVQRGRGWEAWWEERPANAYLLYAPREAPK